MFGLKVVSSVVWYGIFAAAVLAASASAQQVSGEQAVRTASVGQGDPIWAQSPLYSSSRAAVTQIVTTATADVVILGGGYDEGFREGMACEVLRNGEPVAELMIVRCLNGHSAALITALKADTGIVPGDVAKIKTVHPF